MSVRRYGRVRAALRSQSRWLLRSVLRRSRRDHGTQDWDPHPGRVVTDVRTYRDDFDYRTVSNALIRELREQWPEDVVDEWHDNRNVEP